VRFPSSHGWDFIHDDSFGMRRETRTKISLCRGIFWQFHRCTSWNGEIVEQTIPSEADHWSSAVKAQITQNGVPESIYVKKNYPAAGTSQVG
jgi:hypothetical protein